ncbi:MAG: YraN family protein [Chitinivibrionia bacterium]|nr:YraN family protein [Chitinivibrionia bacterium]
MDTRSLGELGEKIAEAFLRMKGYAILAKNYRYAGREIDLIARRGNVLAAVEVKLRRGDRFGSAVESVDSRKVARIAVALEGYIRSRDDAASPRIDLVVIDMSPDMHEMTVRHLEGIC